MLKHPPILGGPAQEGMLVIDVLSQKLMGLVEFYGEAYLDVGCGNGAFTVGLGNKFNRVVGIDVESNRLIDFSRNRRAYRVLVCQMSAEEMGFADETFDLISAIEVLEHIPNLSKAIFEIHRVLKSGGYFCITCPNQWFPFETHGIKLLGREIGGRYPLLTYFPSLHSRIALARVFTVRSLDSIITPIGFKRTGLDFAFPTFERGSRWGKLFRPLRNLMRWLERTPLRVFGVSIVAAYQKVDR